MLPTSVLIARVAVATMFALASASKLRSRKAFAGFTSSIGELGVLRAFQTPTAGIIVGTEVSIVLLLSASGQTSLGFVAAAGLLTLFCVAIAYNILRGEDVRCNCFGSTGETLGKTHLARNGFVIALSVLALAALTSGDMQLRLWSSRGVLGILLGLLLGGLISRWEDVQYALSV